ncbi:hypothetical protein DIPPA_26512 [Diplonema papillatum]|nr:hypothetical protein DIPPA_26512 [Diplonema papillatum]
MLVCLAQHVAVLASLAGPLGWVWAPAGKACDEACAARGAGCSEARWPATEPAFVGVAAALKVPCAVTAPGGLFEAPATLPSGACAWLGPERTWDRGEIRAALLENTWAPHQAALPLRPARAGRRLQ